MDNKEIKQPQADAYYGDNDITLDDSLNIDWLDEENK